MATPIPEEWKWQLFQDNAAFDDLAWKIFEYQSEGTLAYKSYLNALGAAYAHPAGVSYPPFLPIELFKSRQVRYGTFQEQALFESSGTTGQITSHHYIKDLGLYEQSFTLGFERRYGSASSYAILGLLPSYLERSHSSLVYMVEGLMRLSGHPKNGFYLYDFEELRRTILQLEAEGQPTLLVGVTFALLDFSDFAPMNLTHTVVMETGGMKGRREEWTRQQVHAQLKAAFGLSGVHSEYGMTELLSQAYSSAEGRYQCPPWMRVLLRDENDPFLLSDSRDLDQPRTGLINIIDLANLYSCSFIATEDIGRLHPDGSFEVLGRMDNSALRGCSLMAGSEARWA